MRYSNGNYWIENLPSQDLRKYTDVLKLAPLTEEAPFQLK